MSRLIYGIAAGVSALATYHLYTSTRRDSVSSIGVDDLKGKSSVDPFTLPVDINDEPSSSSKISNEDLEAKLAQLYEDVLRITQERDEATLNAKKLSEELSKETSMRCYLQTKSASLLHEHNTQQQMYERKLDDLRIANRDAIALHEDLCQQKFVLQLDNARLQNQVDLISTDLINVTAERDEVVMKNGILAEEVRDVQCRLQGALSNVQNLQVALDSHGKGLLELAARLDTSVAKISELELVNGCQSNKIAELERSVQDWATKSSPVMSEKPVAAQVENAKPEVPDQELSVCDDNTVPSVDESKRPSHQADVQDFAAPSLAQSVPHYEKVAKKPEVPIFPCMDIRYRNTDIQGYTVTLESSGGIEVNSSPKQDPIAEGKPMTPAPAKQEPLPKAGSYTFKVIDAVDEKELPDSYQLLQIGGENYGHIIGREGKNIKVFQEAHGVRVVVTPPRGPSGKVRVFITQGSRESRRNVAKQIVHGLPAMVEIGVGFVGSLTPQRRKKLWQTYFVDITEEGSDGKCVLRGKLGNCLRLFKEQRIQKV